MSAVLKYRPEIDGIRALAVLAVVVFHFDPQWLPGGFSGVDVFFVLSGFLITSIISKEHIQGGFSFSSFYIRRMKRILPPLYIVLVSVITLGIWLLTPRDFLYLRDATKYIVFFVSNIFFSQSGDYFAPQATEMPLLHTWSLAVEEQFYFVWPLFFVLISKFFSRYRFWIFSVLAIISFIAGEYFLRVSLDKRYAYYSLFTRGGELLVGAIGALWLSKENAFSKTGSLLFAFTGLIFLIYSFVGLSEASLFPGINALFPTLGAMFVIAGMNDQKGLMTRIFSLSSVVHIGKLSYSIYLWHWPILAYMRYVTGSHKLTAFHLSLAAILTYLFSALSYYLFEIRIRRIGFKFWPAFTCCFLIPSILMFALLGAAINWFPQQKNTDSKYTTYGGEEVCHGKISTECVRGDLSQKPRILVFGDSHGAHLNYFFDQLGKAQGWSALVLTASSCGPAFDFATEKLPKDAREDCKELLAYIQNNFAQYETVVMAARWEFQLGVVESEFRDPQFTDKMSRTLELIKKQIPKVVVFSQVPLLTGDPFRTERALAIGIPASIRRNLASDQANTLVANIVAKQGGVSWVDLSKGLSHLTEGAFLQGQSVYMDNNHLSRFGAENLAAIYIKHSKDLILPF